MSDQVKKSIAVDEDAELKDLQKKALLNQLREQEETREAAQLVKAGRVGKLKDRGAALRSEDAYNRRTQSNCNHLKGGEGAQGVVSGQGDGDQHSVIKHVLPNGELLVLCQRCGEPWLPAMKEDYEKDGVLDVEAYANAVADYKAATGWHTKNKTSTSVGFTSADGDRKKFSKSFREAIKHTTYR